ncbi:hypothetical protein B0H10DRAFT_1998722 [Mycena sp. CBHHK59/15]|nr:hypothetical protein B0H10DRAFT_1998722 [Mycena sp. CBHHK59/15]
MSRPYSYGRVNMDGEVFDLEQLHADVAPTSGRPPPGDSHGPMTPSRGKFSSWIGSPSELPYDTTRQGTPQWSPKLLHLLPMCLFVAFLLLLIVGLEMLNRHSPYNAPSAGMQFIWTYLPVALLMVVEWIWVAYDLQVKVLVPWASMSHGPTPAAKGWLLDYIGTNYLVRIWTAIKYRHVVVLLTSVGLWATAIAGIATTSLFQSHDVSYTSPATLVRTTSLLDPASVGPSIFADKSYISYYLGRQVLSLSRPRWTTSDNIAIEAFADPSATSVAEMLRATTKGYSADLNCTAATVSYAGNVSIVGLDPDIPQAWAFLANVDAAGCQATYNLTDTNTGRVFADQIYSYGRVYNHTCPGSSTFTTVFALVMMSNYKFISGSAVSCSPSYSQHEISVSTPSSSSLPLTVSVIPGASEALSVPAWAGMLQWINSTTGLPRLQDIDIQFQTDPWAEWNNAAITLNCDCDPWFYLVGHGQNVNETQLMDAGVLANASRVSFTEIFSDAAQSLLMSAPPAAAAAASIAGFVDVTAPWLMARVASIRIAQAALSVLAAVALAVYLLRPQPDLPVDPSSMAAQAFLLQSSHDEIALVIKDTATMSDRETRLMLKDQAFSVTNGRRFFIGSQRLGSDVPTPGPLRKAPVWRPVALHPLFKLALCLIVIGTIITLEFTLGRSRANYGFGDLPASGQDSWTYVVPAYLFILGLVLSSYTFSVSTLEPFFEMHRAPQPARRSVRYSPAHRTAVGLMYHALRYQSVVGLSCAAIMLTVPFLKIAVSGLITTAAAPVQNAAQVSVTTMFNTTTIFPLDDNAETLVSMILPGQTLALSQIEKYQLPLPPWTTTLGAVGQLDLGQLGQLVQVPNTTVTIPLPVMRAELGPCAPLTGVDLVILPSNQVQLPLPPTTVDPTLDNNPVCNFNGNIDTNYGKPENISLSFPSSPGWFGQLYRPTCGGYVIIYGRTQSANVSQIGDITVVQCASYNLSMSTQDVTLAYVAKTVDILSIDWSNPKDTIVMNSFPINESGYLDHYLPTANYEANSSLSFDAFMQIMTLRNTSVPLDAYLDPATLTGAAQALYTAYWAIFASLNLVIPINATSAQPADAVARFSRTRIVQAATPTRILEALLGGVLVFGLITAFMVRQTNHVLTKPPYSIGATMGLLVDSAFVELEELRGVQRLGDLDRALEPYAFHLGWGTNPKGGNRFGVDIVTN